MKIKIICIAYCVFLLSGCAILRNDGSLLPSWRHIKESAVDAALSPGTWVPMTGAAILKAGSWDYELSDWASTHNPVFGSRENARRYSLYLTAAAYAVNTITSLAIPDRVPLETRAFNKVRLLAIHYVAGEIINGIPGMPNEVKYKIRPDFSTFMTFPYGYIPSAAIHAARASRNIEFLPFLKKIRLPMQIGFSSLAVASAWARVEANERSAAGALAELALGNFIGGFINNVFFSRAGEGLSLYVNPVSNVFLIGLSWYF